MKSVVIVDDESAGRKLIKEYLIEFDEFEIIGESDNGFQAIKTINELKPDLIFLDIEMPGLNGFEVLTHLEEIPQIIFSTAFDKYALEAFEVHAVDYLLKPYTKDRFSKAISKLKNNLGSIGKLTEHLIMEKQSFPQRILVESGKKLVTIAVQDIVNIQAAGDYSEIKMKDNSFLSNYGISRLEEKLDNKKFIRVHRSHIINLEHVQSVEKHLNSYTIQMNNQTIIPVSRGYKDQIKKMTF